MQGLVGLGLEQEEEPVVVNATSAYLHCGRVYAEVAYGNCWWLMFDGCGHIAEHWLRSLRVGDFLGSVSMWYPC